MVNDEKEKKIENYIKELASKINDKYNNLLNDENIQSLILHFKDFNDDYNEIVEKINQSINDNLGKFIINKIKSEMPHKYIVVDKIVKSMTGSLSANETNAFIINHFNEICNLTDDELTPMCLNELKQMRNYNIEVDHQIPIIMQNIFVSNRFQSLMSDILSNPNTAGEHIDSIIDDTYLGYNIYKSRQIINFVAQYIMIHKGDYDIENIFNTLDNINFNELSDTETENLFNDLIVSSVMKKLNLTNINSLETKKLVSQYIHTNLINDGFCFQGIRGVYENSVKENGLTVKFSKNNLDDLKKVDEIFKKHGLDKIFRSKLTETKDAPYYYLTDDMGMAFHYSYHNPEYFSYFVASGNNMPDQEYERLAYYMNDYEACKNNLTKLCNNYKLTNEETDIILGCFNNLWTQFLGNSETNSIVMVQRKLINRDKIPLENIDFNNANINEIVSKIRKSHYSIDIQYDNIPKEKIDVIKIPYLSKFYKKETFVGLQKKKYIRLPDRSKYYYDILINIDKDDYDCITIDDTAIPSLESIKSFTGKTIDVIHCNENLETNPLLSNVGMSFQNLEMLIAVNGIANSQKGKIMIEKARNKYSPEYLKDYYYHLCQLSCTIAQDTENYTPQARASALARMAKDFFPKAELMRMTSDYPKYIDEEIKIDAYMEYPIRLILSEVNNIRRTNNGSLEAIETLSRYFQSRINEKVNPNFINIFKSELEKMNPNLTEIRKKKFYDTFIQYEKNITQQNNISNQNKEITPNDLQTKKSKHIENSTIQPYNYHTHTNRCGHTSIASDKEYVQFAKQVGITQLGFTDHVPVSELEYQDSEQRMHISDVDEYITSIRQLQQENPNMKIICGFEAEFDPMKEQFLGELRDKVDYMILGQHFVPYGMSKLPQKNNPEYPIQYAEMLCRAMESGIFDIVAHPDTFMQFRDSLDTEEKKNLFMQNAKIASQLICDKAKELGIPIELNFGGINKGTIMQDGQLAYPHSDFWQIAAETGVSVLYGVDAHTPEQFITMGSEKQKADAIIDPTKLNLVDKNYNPVEARKNNKKLQELYQKGQAKALTYETHLITQITSGIIDRIPDEEFSPETFAYMSEYELANVSQDSTNKASERDKTTISRIETISSDPKLTPQEKAFQLSRAKSTIEHTNDTLSQQQSALERARETISTSVEMGCQSKQDFKAVTTQITEGKKTKSNDRRSKISKNLQTVQLANNPTTKKEQTKGPVLVKKINSNNNSSSNGNKGFINTVILTLIITFVCGIAVGIGYMLYKISIG